MPEGCDIVLGAESLMKVIQALRIIGWALTMFLVVYTVMAFIKVTTGRG